MRNKFTKRSILAWMLAICFVFTDIAPVQQVFAAGSTIQDDSDSGDDSTLIEDSDSVNYTDDSDDDTVITIDATDGSVKTDSSIHTDEEESSTESQKGDVITSVSEYTDSDEEVSNQLLVCTDDISVFDETAVILSEYNSVYLVEYADITAAKKAYEKLSNNHKVEFVDYNLEFEVSDPDDVKADDSNMNEGDDAISVLNDLIEDDSVAADGENINQKTIAVIDSGIKADDLVLDASLIDNGDTTDNNGHGTKMYGYIREENPKANIMSIKVVGSDGKASVSDVYAGLQLAIAQKPDIINISLSMLDNGNAETIKAAIKEARSEGIQVVVSAGNNNRNSRYYVPSNIADVYVIGALNSDLTKLSSSNFGAFVDYYLVAASTSEAAARYSGKLSINSTNGVYDNYSITSAGDDTAPASEYSDSDFAKNLETYIANQDYRENNYVKTGFKANINFLFIKDFDAYYNYNDHFVDRDKDIDLESLVNSEQYLFDVYDDGTDEYKIFVDSLLLNNNVEVKDVYASLYCTQGIDFTDYKFDENTGIISVPKSDFYDEAYLEHVVYNENSGVDASNVDSLDVKDDSPIQFQFGINVKDISVKNKVNVVIHNDVNADVKTVSHVETIDPLTGYICLPFVDAENAATFNNTYDIVYFINDINMSAKKGLSTKLDDDGNMFLYYHSFTMPQIDIFIVDKNSNEFEVNYDAPGAYCDYPIASLDCTVSYISQYVGTTYDGTVPVVDTNFTWSKVQGSNVSIPGGYDPGAIWNYGRVFNYDGSEWTSPFALIVGAIKYSALDDFYPIKSINQGGGWIVIPCIDHTTPTQNSDPFWDGLNIAHRVMTVDATNKKAVIRFWIRYKHAATRINNQYAEAQYVFDIDGGYDYWLTMEKESSSSTVKPSMSGIEYKVYTDSTLSTAIGTFTLGPSGTVGSASIASTAPDGWKIDSSYPTWMKYEGDKESQTVYIQESKTNDFYALSDEVKSATLDDGDHDEVTVNFTNTPYVYAVAVNLDKGSAFGNYSPSLDGTTMNVKIGDHTFTATLDANGKIKAVSGPSGVTRTSTDGNSTTYPIYKLVGDTIYYADTSNSNVTIAVSEKAANSNYYPTTASVSGTIAPTKFEVGKFGTIENNIAAGSKYGPVSTKTFGHTSPLNEVAKIKGHYIDFQKQSWVNSPLSLENITYTISHLTIKYSDGTTSDRGGEWTVTLNSNGTVKSITQITAPTSNYTGTKGGFIVSAVNNKRIYSYVTPNVSSISYTIKEKNSNANYYYDSQQDVFSYGTFTNFNIVDTNSANFDSDATFKTYLTGAARLNTLTAGYTYKTAPSSSATWASSAAIDMPAMKLQAVTVTKHSKWLVNGKEPDKDGTVYQITVKDKGNTFSGVWNFTLDKNGKVKEVTTVTAPKCLAGYDSKTKLITYDTFDVNGTKYLALYVYKDVENLTYNVKEITANDNYYLNPFNKTYTGTNFYNIPITDTDSLDTVEKFQAYLKTNHKIIASNVNSNYVYKYEGDRANNIPENDPLLEYPKVYNYAISLHKTSTTSKYDYPMDDIVYTLTYTDGANRVFKFDFTLDEFGYPKSITPYNSNPADNYDSEVFNFVVYKKHTDNNGTYKDLAYTAKYKKNAFYEDLTTVNGTYYYLSFQSHLGTIAKDRIKIEEKQTNKHYIKNTKVNYVGQLTGKESPNPHDTADKVKGLAIKHITADIELDMATFGSNTSKFDATIDQPYSWYSPQKKSIMDWAYKYYNYSLEDAKFGIYDLDVNRNGTLDLGEDLNNNGKLDPGEDTNHDGKLDMGEAVFSDDRLVLTYQTDKDGFIKPATIVYGAMGDPNINIYTTMNYDLTGKYKANNTEGIRLMPGVYEVVELESPAYYRNPFVQLDIGGNPYNMPPKEGIINSEYTYVKPDGEFVQGYLIEDDPTTRIPALKLIKTDADGNPLPGVKYQFEYYETEADYKVGRAKTSAVFETQLQNIDGDNVAYIDFNDLSYIVSGDVPTNEDPDYPKVIRPIGYYSFWEIETSSPNYILDKNVYSFKVIPKPVSDVHSDGIDVSGYSDADVEWLPTKVSPVVNKTIMDESQHHNFGRFGELKLYKYDRWLEANKALGYRSLEGIEFTVFANEEFDYTLDGETFIHVKKGDVMPMYEVNADGSMKTDGSGNPIEHDAVLLTDNKGQIHFKGIPATKISLNTENKIVLETGINVIVKETATNDDYVLTDDVEYTALIDAGEGVKPYELQCWGYKDSGNWPKYGYIGLQKINQYTGEKIPFPHTNFKGIQFEVSYAETFTDFDGNKHNAGEVVGTYTCNEAGYVITDKLIGVKLIEDTVLKPGVQYSVREVGDGNKWYFNDDTNVYYFTIYGKEDAEGNDLLTVQDCTLECKNVDDNGNYISGGDSPIWYPDSVAVESETNEHVAYYQDVIKEKAVVDQCYQFEGDEVRVDNYVYYDNDTPVLDKDGNPIMQSYTFTVLGQNDPEKLIEEDEEAGHYAVLFTYDFAKDYGIDLTGKTIVFKNHFTAVTYDRLTATHDDITNAKETIHYPEISTYAFDFDTNTKQIKLGEAEVDDIVTYKNMLPDLQIGFKGELYDVATGELLGKDVDLEPVTTQSDEALLSKETDDVTLKLNIPDTSIFTNRDIVVYAHMYLYDQDKEDKFYHLLADHADKNDLDETAYVGYIETDAYWIDDRRVETEDDGTITSENVASSTDAEANVADLNGGKHEKEGTISTYADIIYYWNFLPGETYHQVAQLYNLDGTPFLINGEPVITESDFVPENQTGEYEAIFENVDTTKLDGTEFEVYEEVYLNGVLIAEHKDLTSDRQWGSVPAIKTKAFVTETGDKLVPLADNVELTDEVTYTKLVKDHSYALDLEVRDYDTNLVIATGHKDFKAEDKDGVVEVPFELKNTLDMQGKILVVFETLYDTGLQGADPKEIASERSLRNIDQTVYIGKVKTTATTDGKGKMLELSEKTTLTDLVETINLTVGEEYLVKTWLINKKDGSEITSFEGTVKLDDTKQFNIDFKDIDTTKLVGTDLVVFEEVYDVTGKYLYASHKDLKDLGQTVYVPEIHTNAYGSTESKTIALDTHALVRDIIDTKNLDPDVTYLVKTYLMDPKTGKEITNSSKITKMRDDNTFLIEMYVDSTKLENDKLVVFEEIYDITGKKKYAEHKDLNDEKQTVMKGKAKTKAFDLLTQTNQLVLSEKTSVVDVITTENLDLNDIYTISTSVVDVDTNLVVASNTVNDQTIDQDGTVRISLELNTLDLINKKLVIFEEIYNSNGELVAEHKEITDLDQTVYVGELKTNASVNNAKETEPSRETPITDKITYTNIIDGTYKVKTEYVRKSTGEVVSLLEKEVTLDGSGSFEIVNTVDTSACAGDSIVIFEYIYDLNGNLLVQHADINDTAQTISVKYYTTPPNTGVDQLFRLFLTLGSIFALIALLGVVAFKKRKLFIK